jgi:hypothetical protein
MMEKRLMAAKHGYRISSNRGRMSPYFSIHRLGGRTIGEGLTIRSTAHVVALFFDHRLEGRTTVNIG